MPTTYTPLRYPGGKSRLSPFVTSLIRENGITRCNYVEPYAGGAGLALNLLFNEVAWSIHINDLNPFIYAFWHSVIHENIKLCDLIQNCDITMDEWHHQKQILSSNPKSLTMIEKAFATLFLNRTNRSGILDGGVIGGFGQHGKYKINARFTKPTLIRKIKRISDYKGRIKITQLDALALLNNMDPTDSTLVNLDPPYIEQGKNLYLNHYMQSDHTQVRDFLRSTELNWMLTYDNHELAESLYSDFNCHRFSLNYTAQRRYEATELLVLSDNLRMPMSSPISLVA